MVMTRKESPPIGTVTAMPCNTLPVTTPRRIATLFSAKVNAPRAAYRTPNNNFPPRPFLVAALARSLRDTARLSRRPGRGAADGNTARVYNGDVARRSAAALGEPAI